MNNTPFDVDDGDPMRQVGKRTVSAKERSWTTGDYLTHCFNPELGIGRVTALENRALVVEFPRSGTTLRLAASTDALIPVDLSPGRPVRILATREETTVKARLPDGTVRLANGRAAASHELWPVELEGTDALGRRKRRLHVVPLRKMLLQNGDEVGLIIHNQNALASATRSLARLA